MIDNVDERTLLARERTVLANERNRLANERTYLAWIRTGLASVGGGLAIIRFLAFKNINHEILSQITGSILVILGIAIFALSFFDYRKSFKKLKIEKYHAVSLWTTTIISFTLIIISFILLFIAFKIP